MKAVLLGLGQVGLSFLDILHSSRGSRISGLVDIVSVADTSGSLSSNRRLSPGDLAIAKRAGRMTELKGWEEGMDAVHAVSSSDAGLLIDCTTTNFTDAEPSLGCIIAAMRKGMHVVTANKGPLALFMSRIKEEAYRNSVVLKYGATVGGGTPFIDYGLMLAEKTGVRALRGILNGTVNYTLTRMEEGLSFTAAIGEAKSAGIAETDPTNDVNGTDSAAKLVILVNSLCGLDFSLRDVRVTGIEELAPAEIREAASRGMSMRLVSSYDQESGILSVVTAVLRAEDHINVSGVYNSLSYLTDGRFTLIGRGAGGKSTAQAIVRDVLAITSGTK